MRPRNHADSQCTSTYIDIGKKVPRQAKKVSVYIYGVDCIFEQNERRRKKNLLIRRYCVLRLQQLTAASSFALNKFHCTSYIYI